MAWKKFRERFKKHKPDENQFVLGLDLGNAMSSIAYFDAIRQAPEVIDMSGGYGKPSVPTVLQYAPAAKEWIYGEYAVLNHDTGREQTFNNLVDRLGKNEYAEVNGKPISAASLLGLYCKDLVSACKSLNPKAEIAGIVAAVPSYITDNAKAEYLAAFQAAGLERELITLLPDRECIFHRYYYNKPPAAERILLLDFGSREIRGGIYDTAPDAALGLHIDCVSSLFDRSLGVQHVNARVQDYFSDFYCTKTNTAKDALPASVQAQLLVFTHQHKDLLFQKAPGVKPVKLYYNFAYPPLQQAVSAEDVHGLIAPFADGFTAFLQNVCSKTVAAHTSNPVTREGIQTVLCTGGGFEMLWARQLVQAAFPDSRVVFGRNVKGMIAEGAGIAAAAALGIIPAKAQRVTDRHMLNTDIGIKVLTEQKERFMPLVERNSFWWQEREPAYFILNEATGTQTTALELFRRTETGEIRPLGRAALAGLPARPAGTTKLKLLCRCDSYDTLTAVVADAGFGELFPSCGFEKTYHFAL